MLMSGLEEIRIKYLEKAAECLMVSSPAISAHIRAERNATLYNGEVDNSISLDSLQSCNACGAILIDGWSCKRVKTLTKYMAAVPPTRQRRSQLQTKKLSCSTCGAVTVTQAGKPSKRTLRYSATHEKTLPKAIENDGPSATLQPKQTEFKTAHRRARNKKSSLKSMLTEQKNDMSKTSGALGLDLMDLMQR